MRKRYWIILISIFVAVFAINCIAWNSTSFCDFYVARIFPVWLNVYGRFTSLFPFSVGEIMILLGLALLVIAAACTVTLSVIFISGTASPVSEKIRAAAKKYLSVFAYILACVALIMSLNCFPLYHCSTFEEKYMEHTEKEYTFDELASLRDYIVLKANTLARALERDEDGFVIYQGNMEKAAIESMQNLGNDYEQLAGFYVTPKKLLFSNFMSQQSMRGYYFPFSMEANYNGVMTSLNKPSTMCHELAHTKGFIYEDEANLIGFLACVKSDDPYFQYSGYLSVLNYIDNDFYRAAGKDSSVYYSHILIEPEVKKDNRFLTEEAKKTMEEKAVLKTETVEKAASEFINTNLLMNGISEGALSYAKVVGLLMEYYDGDFDELPGMEVPGEEYLVAENQDS